jgi:thiamine-phosphate pyrophosphorylase
VSTHADLRFSGLYALCDDTVIPAAELLPKARAMLRGGARALQLRAKTLSTRDALGLARALKVECAEWNAVLIINDRVDIALLAGADGHRVHVEAC